MTIPSTIGGGVATNVPVKPLRREGIRCQKVSHGSRSYPGIETIPAAGLSTDVARAGVVVRPAPASGRDPCRLRRRYRSSRVTNVQHLQLALLSSRSLSWQRPTTRDKLYDLTSYVKKSKINIACISEMKNFNPEGKRSPSSSSNNICLFEVQNWFSEWRICGANWIFPQYWSWTRKNWGPINS